MDDSQRYQRGSPRVYSEVADTQVPDPLVTEILSTKEGNHHVMAHKGNSGNNDETGGEPKTCPNCSREVSPVATDCKHCGKSLRTGRYSGGAGDTGSSRGYDPSLERVLFACVSGSTKKTAIAKGNTACEFWAEKEEMFIWEASSVTESNSLEKLAKNYGFPSIGKWETLTIDGDPEDELSEIFRISERKGVFGNSNNERVAFVDETGSPFDSRSDVVAHLEDLEDAWVIAGVATQ
jgi:hypothetical protein